MTTPDKHLLDPKSRTGAVGGEGTSNGNADLHALAPPGHPVTATDGQHCRSNGAEHIQASNGSAQLVSETSLMHAPSSGDAHEAHTEAATSFMHTEQGQQIAARLSELQQQKQAQGLQRDVTDSEASRIAASMAVRRSIRATLSTYLCCRQSVAFPVHYAHGSYRHEHKPLALSAFTSRHGQ